MRTPAWLALVALAACGTPAAPADPATETPVDATQRTFGMNLKMSENGALSADVYGDTAFQRPGTEVTELRGVRVLFYQTEGTRPGELTSETGEYDPETGIMVARGDVVLVTYNERGERRVVKSDELHYDPRGDRVWSERETIVEETDRTLVSDGFESDTRFTSIRGKNSRTGGVRVNEGGGL